jgi:hypothetical protein
MSDTNTCHCGQRASERSPVFADGTRCCDECLEYAAEFAEFDEETP